MSFSSMNALDRQVVIAGGVAAIVAVISFLDPSGSWGAIMILALLGALGALFVALQPRLAPTMKLPMSKSLALLVSAAVTAGAYVIAVISYLSYVFKYLTDVYVLLMLVGLVASLYLLWIGWQAYQREPKAAAPPPAPPAPPTA